MFAPLTLLVIALQGAVPSAATPAASVPERAAAVVVRHPGSPAVETRLARADSLAFAGDMDAAQSLYRSVINGETDAGRYPKDALWHLAMAYDLANDPFNTVRTLDQLASTAGQFGDPETELVASYEAARFYDAMRQPVISRDRIARVRCLMESPVIPDAVKSDYRARLNTQN